MSHLFYCFLVQFDRVVLQKKTYHSFQGPSWGGYLCPHVMALYVPICPGYVLMSPSLDFKTCRFVNN